jgi:hypothetical protein
MTGPSYMARWRFPPDHPLAGHQSLALVLDIKDTGPPASFSGGERPDVPEALLALSAVAGAAVTGALQLQVVWGTVPGA